MSNDDIVDNNDGDNECCTRLIGEVIPVFRISSDSVDVD